MPLSFLQRAKRALVSVLLKLAFDYGVAADINRESEDRAVLQRYRRVVKKVHPDKGGHKKTFQTLQVAKEAWDTARQGARPAGNPALVEGQLVLASAQSKQYRVHAQAVLPTYSGKWSLQLWAAFVAYRNSNAKGVTSGAKLRSLEIKPSFGHHTGPIFLTFSVCLKICMLFFRVDFKLCFSVVFHVFSDRRKLSNRVKAM